MKITDIRPPEDAPKVIDFIGRLTKHSATGAPADWIHRKKDGTVTQGIEEVFAAPAAPTSSRGTETILVVEDQPAVLAVTRRILASHGYTPSEIRP